MIDASHRTETFSGRFVVLAVLFVTCLITANIAAVKLVDVWGMVLPAGIIIFPAGYVIADVITEVYGFRAMRRVIWLGFACNLLTVLTIAAAGALPGAAFWDGQEAFDAILGQTPRILAASLIAYMVGEFANAWLMVRIKALTEGRWLWMRTIGSTIVGEGLDSAVFLTIAFVGKLPAEVLVGAILTQWLVKVVYEALVTPVTYAAVAGLKAREPAPQESAAQEPAPSAA